MIKAWKCLNVNVLILDFMLILMVNVKNAIIRVPSVQVILYLLNKNYIYFYYFLNKKFNLFNIRTIGKLMHLMLII